jgi:hypothetical protein
VQEQSEFSYSLVGLYSDEKRKVGTSGPFNVFVTFNIFDGPTHYAPPINYRLNLICSMYEGHNWMYTELDFKRKNFAVTLKGINCFAI